MERTTWKLNTSNLSKFEEFKRLFTKHGCDLEASHVDLKEIAADPISVVAHKASQLEENVLVEDTSLEIEGASVGVNIRWLLKHLHQYAGHKAVWTVLLAFRKNSTVLIYKGVISGTIVEPKGTHGFGFDPIFLPNGASKTLAESKPDEVNARAKAVVALITGDSSASHPIIENWDGAWQENDH
jgi:XTP/dITP diphosphohydrolase